MYVCFTMCYYFDILTNNNRIIVHKINLCSRHTSSYKQMLENPADCPFILLFDVRYCYSVTNSEHTINTRKYDDSALQND